MIKTFREKSKIIFRRLRKEIDLILASRIDISSIQSLVLIIGPYRNLTTLTASVAHFHPNCRVLNHAGIRIFNDPRIDFLKFHSQDILNRFMKYAMHISTHGKQGKYGGSITLSHAIKDRSDSRELSIRVEKELPSKEIVCLLWKESQYVINHIRYLGVSFDELISYTDKLKFIFPIRNPLDCAMSHFGRGFSNTLPGIDIRSSPEEILKVILDEYLWFINLQDNFPGRFHHFYAHEKPEQILLGLTKFAGIERHPKWLEYSKEMFFDKSNYRHDNRLKRFYINYLNENFSEFPEFHEKLTAFVR